jgi:hypothetical protein
MLIKTINFNPDIFGNMCSKFKKNVTNLQHEDEGTQVIKPFKISYAFPKHFKSIHNNSCPEVFPVTNQCMDL